MKALWEEPNFPSRTQSTTLNKNKNWKFFYFCWINKSTELTKAKCTSQYIYIYIKNVVWDRCTWYGCTKTEKEKNMKPYALGLDETKTRCRITETRKKREKSLFLKLWCLALFAQVWTNLRSQYVVGATCRYFPGWGCRRELKISPFDKTHIFFWMW